MKSIGQPWRIFLRNLVNGILYVQVKDKETGKYMSEKSTGYEDAPQEVKPLLEQLSTLTFYDYILLYWNYEKSPYIQGFIRKGETPPNPERFYHHINCIKKYEKYFPSCLLTEITGFKIGTLLGAIKTEGNVFEGMQYIDYAPGNRNALFFSAQKPQA